MKNLSYEASTKPSREASRTSGLATVEMALMLPFLILIMIGVIDVARAAFVGIAVANAASAGALYGAQGPGYAVSTDDILAAATADAQVSGMTITDSTYCECSDGSASTCTLGECDGERIREYIQVDTQADWTPIFNYPGLPGSVTLRGQSIIQVSEQVNPRGASSPLPFILITVPHGPRAGP